MDVSKAISLISLELKCRPHNIDPDWYDSQVLAIEALKLYQYTRHIGQHVDPVLLPGETKD